MRLQSLTIGQSVKHPQYGFGTVKALSEKTADIAFTDQTRTLDPELSGIMPAEPTATVSGLEQPLHQFLEQSIRSVLTALGYQNPEAVVGLLGSRWHGGKLVLHPADPVLQTKEVPLEIFFHKVVMVRNQLRVLEQKINAHEKLTDAEKVEMQQYITRSYGSLTTFNILFKEKEDQF